MSLYKATIPSLDKKRQKRRYEAALARILAGPIPDPDDLFGREREIEQCWSIIDRANLLLLAPRRFGKSGLMRHMERLPRNSFQPVWLHLEHIVDGPGFAELLIEAIRRDGQLNDLLRTGSKWLKEKFDRLDSVEGVGLGKITLRAADSPTWQTVVADITSALEKAPRPILFLCDELPAMVKAVAGSQGDDEARRFMQWFRSLRLNSNNQLRRHRFVVAGSTGLNYFLGRRLGCVETINDFERLPIEPITDKAASELCCALAEAIGATIEKSATEHLLRRIGRPIPYFLHVFFSAAQQGGLQRAGSLDIAAVDFIFDHRVLGAIGRGYFDHYRQRLSQYGRQGERAAVKILAEIAGQPDGQRWDILRSVYNESIGSTADAIEFADLMSDLEVDFYLTRHPTAGTFTFYLLVMGDWWRRWYGLTVRNS